MLPPGDEVDARRRSRLLFAGAATIVVLIAVTIIGFVVLSKPATPPAPAKASSPPAVVLEGTYRLDWADTKITSNGAPAPPDGEHDTNTTWWAFRSFCGSAGCVATSTALDTNDLRVARTPSATKVFQFVDDRWQQTSSGRVTSEHPTCLMDGRIAAGTDTAMAAWSLQPQPDQTLRGVQTTTVLK